MRFLARFAQHVPAVETQSRGRHVLTDAAVVSLVEETLGLHQLLHGQVRGKPVSDVFQALECTLLFFNDGAAAERTEGFLLSLHPVHQTVATQDMSAREQLGFSEQFVTNSAFPFVRLHTD